MNAIPTKIKTFLQFGAALLLISLGFVSVVGPFIALFYLLGSRVYELFLNGDYLKFIYDVSYPQALTQALSDIFVWGLFLPPVVIAVFFVSRTRSFKKILAVAALPVVTYLLTVIFFADSFDSQPLTDFFVKLIALSWIGVLVGLRWAILPYRDLAEGFRFVDPMSEADIVENRRMADEIEAFERFFLKEEQRILDIRWIRLSEKRIGEALERREKMLEAFDSECRKRSEIGYLRELADRIEHVKILRSALKLYTEIDADKLHRVDYTNSIGVQDDIADFDLSEFDPLREKYMKRAGNHWP